LELEILEAPVLRKPGLLFRTEESVWHEGKLPGYPLDRFNFLQILFRRTFYAKDRKNIRIFDGEQKRTRDGAEYIQISELVYTNSDTLRRLRGTWSARQAQRKREPKMNPGSRKVTSL
jgi:hypothetical protein